MRRRLMGWGILLLAVGSVAIAVLDEGAAGPMAGPSAIRFDGGGKAAGLAVFVGQLTVFMPGGSAERSER